MPGGSITAADQFQMGSLLLGSGTFYEVTRFTKKPGVRTYKQPVPGGGSYVPRVESTEKSITLDVEVWGTSASDLATKWAALEAAFAPALDAPFAWRLNDTAKLYVNAHVETPPEIIHDQASDNGFKRVTVIGLVASDPTEYAA